jgi:hypothetical protein
MKRDALVVEVHDKHVDISLRGVTLFHSEDYSNESNARRAAKRFINAVNTREMKLVTYRRGWKVTKKVRRLMTLARSTRKISVPVDVRWSPDPPYFEPHLETLGQ